MIGNRKEDGTVCSYLLHVIRKSRTPSDNRLTAILNRKKPKSIKGCPDRMPLLYHLCHHHYVFIGIQCCLSLSFLMVSPNGAHIPL